MNQSQLCRAVARVTGESVGTIRRMGFALVEPPMPLATYRRGGSHGRRRRMKPAAGAVHFHHEPALPRCP